MQLRNFCVIQVIDRQSVVWTEFWWGKSYGNWEHGKSKYRSDK